jgi:hypothetical protein
MEYSVHCFAMVEMVRGAWVFIYMIAAGENGTIRWRRLGNFATYVEGVNLYFNID